MSREACQVQSRPKCQTSSLSSKLCHCEGPTCVETAPTCGIWGRRRTAFTMFWSGSVILSIFQLWGTKNPFFGSDNCHVSQWQWWRLSTWCMFGTEPFIFCMLLLALNILARFPWISLSLLLSNRTEPIVEPGWSPAFLAEQTWRWWHFGESWRN